VVFRLQANRLVGSGHLHHCLQLAEYLDTHRIEFLLRDCDEFAAETLDKRGWPYRVERDLGGDLRAIADSGRRVVVNDVLNTTVEDVLQERVCGYSVVNVEDLGPGAKHADWVVNALYPPSSIGETPVSTGARYATLRSEFLGLPIKQIRDKPTRVMITFGGTDPTGLAKRVSHALAAKIDCEIVVVLGKGSALFEPPSGVVVLRDVRSMAHEMLVSDLIVTSAGRTVYEAAATGTPVVAISHSAREATHAHLSVDFGVIHLGLGVLIDDAHIVSTVDRLLRNPMLRSELSQRLRASIDSFGARRIAARIQDLLEGV
jgi:spore coat polysaccharide biosynthesis predicted glycosyltransferase SpsG